MIRNKSGQSSAAAEARTAELEKVPQWWNGILRPEVKSVQYHYLTAKSALTLPSKVIADHFVHRILPAQLIKTYKRSNFILTQGTVTSAEELYLMVNHLWNKDEDQNHHFCVDLSGMNEEKTKQYTQYLATAMKENYLDRENVTVICSDKKMAGNLSSKELALHYV